MTYRRPLAALLAAACLTGFAFAAEPTTKPAAKPYPLKTCIITDEELGSMGEPPVIVHEGQEVKFCCGGCVKKFKKDPAKYLKKIEDAKKAPTTQTAALTTAAEPCECD